MTNIYMKIKDTIKYIRECNSYISEHLSDLRRITPESSPERTILKDIEECLDDASWYLHDLESEIEKWWSLSTFPAPGVWLVEGDPNSRSERRISKIGEVPDPVKLASLERYRGDIMNALEDARQSGLSIYDTATKIIRILYEASQIRAKEVNQR